MRDHRTQPYEPMKTRLHLFLALGLLLPFADTRVSAQYQYPFQNPNMPLEERVNNIVSLMTLDEKVALLSQRPGVPRLGIRSMMQVEGLHGLRARGATTTYPQSIGLGETWDTGILHEVGATEGYEARYIFQNTNYHAGALVIRAPNADLGRDIRWGRNEECYGEDPFLTGTLTVAFIKGMQGDDSKYWQAAALLKHFLANSNEKGRAGSSSDFDERLFYEYYSVPFRMGWVEGGARCFMAAYNAWNMIPMTVHPIIQNVVVRIWGVDGVICTDAGSLGNMIRAHRYYGDLAHGAAGAVKAGMNQFLDQYEVPTRDALKQGLLTETDLDKAIKGTFRVWARLGFLDPPEGNPYAKIGAEGTPPWTTQKSKDSVRLATQKSIVVLKNAGGFLPLDKSVLKSVAVIGPRGDEVVRDWYGSTPPYTVTPLAGIKNKVGSGVAVEYADGKDVAAAVALGKSSDVAILCVGNSPNPDNKWMKVNDDSEGREGIDRQNITLGSGQEHDQIETLSGERHEIQPQALRGRYGCHTAIGLRIRHGEGGGHVAGYDPVVAPHALRRNSCRTQIAIKQIAGPRTFFPVDDCDPLSAQIGYGTYPFWIATPHDQTLFPFRECHNMNVSFSK